MTTPELTRLRRIWDRQSGRYDRSMSFWELRLFGQHRDWVTTTCAAARCAR
jgi:hypothetical protein